MDWKLDFIEAKYHLSVAKRMMNSYGEYSEKRFLVGIINETARATSKLIRAFLIYDKIKVKNLKVFFKLIVPKYLDRETSNNLFKILEVEKAQKISPIEFTRGDKIILLINGKYRFLTINRIEEFMKSVSNGIVAFPGKFQQI